MLLSIPFYENTMDGQQCMQVAMKSVLKYFLNQDFSLPELDCLSGRKSGKWTWTSQIVTALDDLGLQTKFYSRSDLEPFLEGEPFIRRYYGKDADKILQYTDLPVFLASIKKLLKYNIFQKQKLPFDQIKSAIKSGYVPLMLIDHNIIAGLKSPYQGHFVVVTGYDEKNVFYHESGPTQPQPNKKVSQSLFLEAWNANGTDNDVIIVSGKKSLQFPVS